MAGLGLFRAHWDQFLWKAHETDEARILEGTASSSAVDAAGDQVMPKGAVYALPMPLLMQHDRDRPVGEVTAAKVSDTEITIRATLAKESGLAYVEDAWRQLKAGLVKGLSIGAQPLKAEPILDSKGAMTGVRYTAWRWLELSAVTLPMNPDAGIAVVKMFDPQAAHRAEPGNLPVDINGPEPADLSYGPTRARAMEALTASARALYRG